MSFFELAPLRKIDTLFPQETSRRSRAVAMDERTTVKRVCNWFTSNFTALSLVVPGVGLYVYIIYIIASKLVYPATFLPFVQSHHLKDEESIDKMGKLLLYRKSFHVKNSFNVKL